MESRHAVHCACYSQDPEDTLNILHAETFLELSGLLFLGYVLLARELQRRAVEFVALQPDQGSEVLPESAPEDQPQAETGVASEVPQVPVRLVAPPPPSPAQEIERLRLLARERGQGAVPELARALRNPSPQVAEAAANMLGQIGGRTALLALMAADRGESEGEILAAASFPEATPTWEAARPRSPLPSPPPSPVLVAPPEPESSSEESEEAEEWEPAGWSPEGGRGTSGEPKGDEPPPPPALRLYEPLARNGFRALHRYSPHDLLDLSEAEVAEVLMGLAKNRAEKPALRYFAIKNLVRFEHPDIRETLLDLLTDILPLVRYACAEALSLKGNSDSVPALVEALEDSEASVRASAAHTLAALGGDIAIRPLLGLRDDEDEVVRYAARRALEAIGKRKKIGALLLRRASVS